MWGASLFAQPLMLAARFRWMVRWLCEASGFAGGAGCKGVLATFRGEGGERPMMWRLLSDHLSLLRRWYYRPEKQREGEVLLPECG